MKKTLFIAAAALSMALGAHAEVKISGKNTQAVTVKNGAVVNMANGNLAEAKQNLASNKGNVARRAEPMGDPHTGAPVAAQW